LYRDSEKASGKEERHATAAVACSDLFSILSSLVCFVLLFLIIIIYFVKKKQIKRKERDGERSTVGT
jgi:flagellar biogenesis protein FliO